MRRGGYRREMVVRDLSSAVSQWLHYGEHQVAPLTRTWGGAIKAVTDNADSRCGRNGPAFRAFEDSSCQVAFEAAPNLAVGFPVGTAPRGVAPGLVVMGHAHHARQHDGVQSAIEPSVVAAIEVESDRLPEGGGHGCFPKRSESIRRLQRQPHGLFSESQPSLSQCRGRVPRRGAQDDRPLPVHSRAGR